MAVRVTTQPDGAAQLVLDIEYNLPGKLACLFEKRTVAFTAPAADGSYGVDWTAAFRVGTAPLVAPENYYGGFAFRAAAYPHWKFLTPEGETTQPTLKPVAPWIAFQGPLPDGQVVTIAIFDAPANYSHPPQWLLISGMPYFNPVITAKGDWALEPGQQFILRYRWQVSAGQLAAGTVEKDYQAWANR